MPLVERSRRVVVRETVNADYGSLNIKLPRELKFHPRPAPCAVLLSVERGILEQRAVPFGRPKGGNRGVAGTRRQEPECSHARAISFAQGCRGRVHVAPINFSAVAGVNAASDLVPRPLIDSRRRERARDVRTRSSVLVGFAQVGRDYRAGADSVTSKLITKARKFNRATPFVLELIALAAAPAA